MEIKALVGSGDRIGLFMLPFIALAVLLVAVTPDVFRLGAEAGLLRPLSLAILAVGIVVWAWSVALILTKVPRGELITTGPFALVKHPLYTGVSLLVLPWAGFLLGSWLGLVLGLVLYVASRRYAPAEEQELARRFGTEWDEYSAKVALPWL